MKREYNDAMAAAEAISKLTKIGEDIARDATLKAGHAMPKMLANINTKEARIEMLRHHGVELGLAARFRREILPLANKMVDDLAELTGDKSHAEMMAEVWLAKVIREVAKQLNEQTN